MASGKGYSFNLTNMAKSGGPLNLWGSKKGQKPGWYQWWEGNTDAETLRDQVASKYGGLDAFTESDKTQMVINMHQSLSSDASNEQVAANLEKFINNTAAGKKYNNAKNSFIQGVKDIIGKNYDKTVYTDDKLSEMFNERVKQGGGDLANVSNVASQISSVIQNDYADKVKAGKIDPDTGEYIQAGAIDKNLTTVQNMTKNMGFELSENGQKYYADLISKGTDPYEVEQMVKSSAEYAEYALDKARDEYGATLDTTLQKELDNLKAVDTSSQESVLKSFEKLAPSITKYAGSLGGTDRAFTTEVLGKQAGELETARQEYLTNAEANIRSNDITRRDLLAQGRLTDAQNIAGYSQEQGLSLFKSQLAEKADTTNKLAQLASNTRSTLAKMAQDRYDNELAKEAKRLETERANALKSAYKKAGKFGLFGSTLQGLVSGAMTGGQAGGVYGAVAGGVLGGGMGYAGGVQQNKGLMSQYNTGTNLYGNSSYDTAAAGNWAGGLFSGNR